MDYAKIKKSIKFLLNGSWFPNWIIREDYSPSKSFVVSDLFVSHDDCDGELEGIRVTIGADGDVWVMVMSDRHRRGVRYRMPMTGGGRYPKVRNALLILAEAIRQTNEDERAA